MFHASNHGLTPSTISVPLPDGTHFTIRDTYSESQSKAIVVRVEHPVSWASPLILVQALIVASCISLVATVGLLFAIAVRPKFDDAY